MTTTGLRPALGAALAIVAVTATASTATADTVPDVNASIVWVDTTFAAAVEVPWGDGTSSTYSTSLTGYCTGFFVSDQGEIATAGHCVETGRSHEVSAIATVLDALSGEGYDVTGLAAENLDWQVSFSDPTIVVGQPLGIPDGVFSGGSTMIAQLVDHQPFERGDNALLRVADLTGTPALAIGATTPMVGDQVVSIGFPGSVMDVSDVQRQLPSYKTGSVSSRQYSGQGVPATEIDAAVSQGMSGGPTINLAGEVVGVNSFGIAGESQPFNFITDTETLRDFLTRNGVDLSATAAPGGNEPVGDTDEAVPVPLGEDAPAQSPASGPTPYLLALAGLLLVALVATAVVIGRSRSQRHQPAASSSGQPAQGFGPTPGHQFPSGPAMPSTAPPQPSPVPTPSYPAPDQPGAWWPAPTPTQPGAAPTPRVR